MIDDAGFEPWPRITHNLRSSGATDLLDQFSAAQVCRMVDKSISVLERHYLRQKDSVLDAVAEAEFDGWNENADDIIHRLRSAADVREVELESVAHSVAHPGALANLGFPAGNADRSSLTIETTRGSGNKKPPGNARGQAAENGVLGRNRTTTTAVFWL